TVHQIYWVAQVGPTAYSFVLTTLPEEQEKLEPYFKRLMMSVRFNVAGHWDEEFETLRAKLANGAASTKDAAAAKLSEAIRTAKEPTAEVIKRIAELAKTAPEIALEILTDYDPNVRAAAITALGQSSDARFTDALVWALTDKDTFCSTSAARALAERGAAGITALKNKLPKLVEENALVLRVAAFMSDENARVLADELLTSDHPAQQRAGLRMAVALPLKGLRLPYAKLFRTDDVHIIGHTLEAIRLRRPTEEAPEFVKMLGTDAELWAIHALGELGAPALVAQLEEKQTALNARYNKLTTAKGVMTIHGGTGVPTKVPPPPPPPLPKSTNRKKNVGKNPPAGIPGRIVYDYLNSSSPASTPPAIFKAQSELTKLWSLILELEAAISKIKFRDRWANAKDAAARQTIWDEAGKNDRLKQWAEKTLKNEAPLSSINLDFAKLQNAPTTGETLFPSNATLYLTAPNFEQTIGKLDAALSGIQLSTVRDQMTFALMLNQIKAQLAQKMNTNLTGSASQTLGIDLKAPISMAAWPNAKAETKDKNANAMAHSAVIVRISDRARFERTLTMYQTDFGGFDSFVPMVSVGARVASITPAAMPVMFYAINAISNLASTVTGQDNASAGMFAGGSSVFARRETLGDLPLTVIEKLGSVGLDATKREQMYIAYLGNTAVLAPTREALLDVLKTDRPTISSNLAFTRIKAESGEIVFFSQLDMLLKNLVSEVGSDEKTPTDTVMNELMTKSIGAETGAVRLSSGAWDSIFHIAIGDNDIVKSVRPFKATELGAPRDLLPKQTLFYAGTVIDPEKLAEAGKRWDAEVAKAWKASGKEPQKEKANEAFSQLFSAFQTIVTPHLQGEVSFAVTNISN
ncbi:MAG TPA: HEAT repeat domain-containing protein, partial [Blastocatellia bacterium]|nr:HEAT repeat domain-containing protein [Blastocatellia bacterium]